MLWGGNGNDSLVGDKGVDFMWGNSGADTFWFHFLSDTGVTRWTMDTIYDFNRAEGDVIQLTNIDAKANTQANDAFNFIGTADFSGAPGELRYYYSAGNTYIEMQTDTDLDPEAAFRLIGIHTPDASWFML